VRETEGESVREVVLARESARARDCDAPTRGMAEDLEAFLTRGGLSEGKLKAALAVRRLGRYT
jgi:hypothetical protein